MAARLTPLRLASPLFVFRAGFRPAITTAAPINARLATTQSSAPNSPPVSKRKSITVVNDTGRIPWQDLSIGEKAARTTQQTFNLGLVLVGLAATGAVFTVLYLEVFSTDSKTAVFNRSADRVRKDPKCIEMLAGEGMHTKREITAHGEPSHSRWARNRTIASRLETDKTGVEHLHMHFYVEGPAANGTVNLHMTKAPGEKDFEYRTLTLDVPEHPRHYLVNVDGLSSGLSKAGGRLFGVRWN
jgi:import inner membrane translocase subunit TIM21